MKKDRLPKQRYIVHLQMEITENQLAYMELQLKTLRVPFKVRCDHCGDYGHVVWHCGLRKQAEQELTAEAKRREKESGQPAYKPPSEVLVPCPTCGFEWPDYMVKLGGVVCCEKPVMITVTDGGK